MTFDDLKLPQFARRKIPKPGFFGSKAAKPPAPVLETLEFTGPQIAEFVTDILGKNPHFTPARLEEIGKAQKIIGVQKPNPSLGKSIGAMYGRHWYTA
jgi:hypothetical protein